MLAVPEEMLGARGEHYVLRVRGDSMIDEHIRDGDYVVVQSRQTAHNGEMVIALVDGENATMKKYYRDGNGRVRLQPANSQVSPMLYPEDRVRVQGIVVGILRKY